MKLLAFIPARMESKRFPNKILKKIFNIPMIEHVRRRILISKVFDDIYVVSNNKNIINKIYINKKNLLITKKKHFSGTSRVAEVSKKKKYDYGFIIFADEPFIDPKIFKVCKRFIRKNPKAEIFNVTTNLKDRDMESQQVVKVVVDKYDYVKNYFRKKTKILSKLKIVKSCGIIIFRKKLLDKLKLLKSSQEERKTKIEQIKFLDNGYKIKSVFFKNIKASINTVKELKDILKEVKSDKKQLKIISNIKKIES